MTNAEARCNKSLRPRKPEGSLGRTAQDVHLDSHTAPELWGTLPLLKCCFTSTETVGLLGTGTLPAQHTTFNTLDNWAIKTPPNQKEKGPERKGYRVMARNMYTIHSVTYVKRHFRPPLKLKGRWLKALTLRTASSLRMHECLFHKHNWFFKPFRN